MINLATKIHRTFRELQRLNAFVSSLPHTGLSLLETTILLELQADPLRSIADFSTLFYLDKQTISRSIQSLVKRGAVIIKSHRDDKRKKRIVLARYGIKLIDISDKHFNNQAAKYAKRVTSSELNKITNFYRSIADSYGHPAGIRRENDTKYRVEQRRITRCFQLLGSKVYKSNFSSLQFHILAELAYGFSLIDKNFSHITQQQLSTRLRCMQNTLSQNLNVLEGKGLINKTIKKNDARLTQIAITRKGRKSFHKIESSAIKLFKHVIDRLEYKSLFDLACTMERFAFGRLRSYSNVAIKELKKPHELVSFRDFCIRALVKQNMTKSCPAQLGDSASNICYGLYLNNILSAAAQFHTSSTKRSAATIKLSCAVYNPKHGLQKFGSQKLHGIDDDLMKEFIDIVKEAVLVRFPTSSFAFNNDPIG